MPRKSQSISFRLSDDKHRRLIGLSAASGLSPGKYARKRVLEKIDGEEAMRGELDSLRADFGSLAVELSAFRREFATAVEALLISSSSGKPVTPEIARRWVDEKIRDRKPMTKVN